MTTSSGARLLAGLRRANAAVDRDYPGESTGRQPVHSFYGGAHLFKKDSAARMGAAALSALNEYAPDADAFAEAFQLGPDVADLAGVLRERVVDKLIREPIEDLRIDFEDGYGIRPDPEEDDHARSVAEEVASGFTAGTLPPFIGIRIKPLSKELHARSLRTLDLFVSTISKAAGRKLPPGFVVTIPKLMTPAHVATVSGACSSLEHRLRLKRGAIALELMIETPQSILAADGSSALRALVSAGEGRVRGAHFGTYDYTALCGITAAFQTMSHLACDFAKHTMQVSLAQSGVWLSDGATNVLPIATHRASPTTTLTPEQRHENRQVVHRAWAQHTNDVRHSLVGGFFQGWDLHPAQLPSRYAAVYAFYAAARPAATARLRNFVDKAARATLVGDVFDDAATGQGLLNFFVRGVGSGALTLDEVRETGLTRNELESRSFLKILEGRRLR